MFDLQEANIQLLQRVTREGGRASCGWAWLRLGLHHLALQNHHPAIQAFQCALTINPDDGCVCVFIYIVVICRACLCIYICSAFL